MKIGIVQTNSGHDVGKNISDLEITLSSLKSADLVITPECTNLMGFDPIKDKLYEEENDPTLNFCREWAKANHVKILIGSLLLNDPKKGNVNRQVLLNEAGDIMTRYDKIHMFDMKLPSGEVYRESERFIAGDKAQVTELGDFCLGHSICFDVRFPKLYRMLAQNGANVLVIPAAFTETTGRAHWEVLLRARAIENGAYVLAPAQTGSFLFHDGSRRHCYGHSMLISPWGEILTDLGKHPATKIVSLNLEEINRARETISAFLMEREFIFQNE